MNKLFTFFILCFIGTSVSAQTATPTTQAFGKINKEDLEMTSCDFEKDANAEVLFDKGTVYFTPQYELVLDRHVRIKIFNEKGKDEANIRIMYYGGNRSEYISNVQAETSNLNNGAVEMTKVDKKQIYTQKVDKIRNELVFSFPDVKPGSVIEYKYSITTHPWNFPDWYFQAHIPTRYSEISSSIPSILSYKNLVMVNQPYAKNTDEIKALANVPSVNEEPYMSSRKDNSERILYELQAVTAPGVYATFSDTWPKVGKELCDYQDFGDQIKRKLTGEDDIINKARGLSSIAEKAAYIFDEVKRTMKWDGLDEFYTNDGTSEAWNKKTGNSTEINLIVNHLLQKTGVTSYPMLVSTRKNGKINPAYPNSYQFNRTVVYIPVDSANYYILDATNKYNVYNQVPRELLNGFGFFIDKGHERYELKFLQNTQPVRQVVLINAEIKADGKMTGTAQLNSFGYHRLNALQRYNTDGEQKFIEYLRDNDNNLKISGIKFGNMEVDTLPLTQTVDFNQSLTGSDESYIYFTANLFTSLRSNPFLSEKRFTDIDFGYRNNYSINGIYKLPAGYKIDAMPKSVNMSMPDNSITFRRIVAEQDGIIVVRYAISYQKSVYFKENYGELHEFFKKMYEMLNEQIVLKKS